MATRAKSVLEVGAVIVGAFVELGAIIMVTITIVEVISAAF